MAPDAGTPRRPVVGRLILRILLVVALVALLALNGVKHAPAIAAALTPATTAPVAAGTSAAPASTAPSTASASASASATVTSGSGGGSGGGGGSGSGGGTTTTSKPSVDSLDVTSVACPDPSAPVNSGGGMSPTVTISWSTSHASTVYFGQNTDDAQANPYSQVASSGSIDVHWPCADATDEFAITAVGSDGTKTTKTITAKNSGYTD